MFIGTAKFTELFLPIVDQLYFTVIEQLNGDQMHLTETTVQLFEKAFIVQLLKRFGLKSFLETFTAHIVDCLVTDEEYTGMFIQ